MKSKEVHFFLYLDNILLMTLPTIYLLVSSFFYNNALI